MSASAGTHGCSPAGPMKWAAKNMPVIGLVDEVPKPTARSVRRALGTLPGHRASAQCRLAVFKIRLPIVASKNAEMLCSQLASCSVFLARDLSDIGTALKRSGDGPDGAAARTARDGVRAASGAAATQVVEPRGGSGGSSNERAVGSSLEHAPARERRRQVCTTADLVSRLRDAWRTRGADLSHAPGQAAGGAAPCGPGR